jgi:hypothetical protein
MFDHFPILKTNHKTSSNPKPIVSDPFFRYLPIVYHDFIAGLLQARFLLGPGFLKWGWTNGCLISMGKCQSRMDDHG